MADKRQIEIYDTTLRDGAQSEGVSFSLQDKIMITESLDNLGVDLIEGGYPLSNPKDEAFFAEITGRKLKNTLVAAFGMTRRRGCSAEEDEGLKALLASDAPVVTIVGKSWNMHVSKVLGVSEDDNLKMISDSVKFCADAGRKVIFDAEHFFDGWRDDNGYALATLKAAHEAGADCLVMCDTNGGSLPDFVAEVTQVVSEKMTGAKLGIHCHNDSGLATANSLAAVTHGASHVQGTINGLGERCGNADLTAIIPNLILKYGYQCLRPGTLKHLTEVSRFVYEVANMNLRENQPFVGSGAFAHKGGMHVHAVRKAAETYEHLDPQIVGNTRRILVSELSGLSNIEECVPKKFNLSGDKKLQRKVLDKLMEQENQGYQFEAAEASFEMLVRRTLGEKWYRPLWRLDHYRCVILRRNDEQVSTEAIVKLTVDEQVEHKVAEGDGPVDSLHNALCAALRGRYPSVDDIHLMDYRVRVVNTAAETAARVRVLVEWRDATSEALFGSVGVSENIIDASWLAILDAIEYKLLNDMGAGDETSAAQKQSE